MPVLANLLAIGWEPELRGYLSVIIGAVALGGSVYLILGTNLGSRLGFLVTFAALFGWMAVMGAVWWTYGIGLMGRLPSWEPANPVAIVRDASLLHQTNAVEEPIAKSDLTGADLKAYVSAELGEQGWTLLPDSDPGRGQAIAAAEDILVNQASEFEVGEFIPVAVYDKGGDRYPKINETLDFLAFLHRPHYSLVEVAPVIPQYVEPGRAPARPIVDESQPRRYVLMIRDMGTHRQPAAFITLGSTGIFLVLSWMLHRRERTLIANRQGQQGELIAAKE
jgi:hypothetical protein